MSKQSLPVVFLCGHRKSGTTLVSNLLDGHPQLAVYPNDLALLYAYFPEFIRLNKEPSARRARLERILFSDMEARFGAGSSDFSLDISALREAFFTGLPDTALGDLKALITRLLEAFQQVREDPGRETRWGVFKETSIEIYAAEVLEWFKDARFVQILRDPRDNFAALAAGVEAHYGSLGEDRNRTLASLLYRARLGFGMAAHNSAAFGPARYHLLRFEDLVQNPEVALRGVAEFLEIDFDDSLLKPTLLGTPTGGNSYDGDAKFTVDARNAGRWRERITAQEAQIIEFHMRSEMAEFCYAPAFSPAEQSAAAADFYKWQNYAYFYRDRFVEKLDA